MTSPSSIPQIPQKLSDAEARKILEQFAPEVRSLGDEIVRNNTRAEEGERNKKQLMERANAHFGVDDGSGVKVVPGGEAGMRQILDERMIANATKVREFFEQFDVARQQVAAVTKASPAR